MNTFLLYLALQADSIRFIIGAALLFSVLGTITAFAFWIVFSDCGCDEGKNAAKRLIKTSTVITVVSACLFALIPDTKSALALLLKYEVNKENYEYLKKEIMDVIKEIKAEKESK